MTAIPKKQQTKSRIWSLKKADTQFSDHIRKRDGCCLFPTCSVTDFKKLQCSYYIGRAHKATRFDPNNCITLCWLHHFKDKLLGFEYQKQTKERHGYDGQYTIFMKKWLGKAKYKNLLIDAAGTKSQTSAIIECMRLLDKKGE